VSAPGAPPDRGPRRFGSVETLAVQLVLLVGRARTGPAQRAPVRGDGLARLDLMRPDGSGRREIAGRGIRSAVPDVAILDRFEILAETGPESDATGTAALLVHDITTGDTVELSPAADDAQSRNGLVWWFSDDAGTARWHVLDLRTA
jgi:hypothetical protein